MVVHRTSTAGSDYASERRLAAVGHRKKVLHQSSLQDEKTHYHFSSNESLGSVIGIPRVLISILLIIVKLRI